MIPSFPGRSKQASANLDGTLRTTQSHCDCEKYRRYDQANPQPGLGKKMCGDELRSHIHRRPGWRCRRLDLRTEKALLYQREKMLGVEGDPFHSADHKRR